MKLLVFTNKNVAIKMQFPIQSKRKILMNIEAHPGSYCML